MRDGLVEGAAENDGAVAPSRWRLPEGPWPTVLDALCACFPQIGRPLWLDRMQRGRVLGPDGALAPDSPCRPGLRLRYYREVPDEQPLPAGERILHQDAHLLVADKPHGLPVAPTGRYLRETLLTRLQLSTGNAQLAPLHRLDRDTAGLVLFSTDPASRGAYAALFRERRIDKDYEALAAPLPQRSWPLCRRSRLVPGQPFFRVTEADGPANSESLIEVLQRAPALWRYRLRPRTGRKHQLRVHMAALGAPILGDPCYPVLRQPDQPDPLPLPLQLLARGLDFIDPLSGVRRSFRSCFELLPESAWEQAAREPAPR